MSFRVLFATLILLCCSLQQSHSQTTWNEQSPHDYSITISHYTVGTPTPGATHQNVTYHGTLVSSIPGDQIDAILWAFARTWSFVYGFEDAPPEGGMVTFKRVDWPHIIVLNGNYQVSCSYLVIVDVPLPRTTPIYWPLTPYQGTGDPPGGPGGGPGGGL